MFSPQQEMDLGDAFHAAIQNDFRVIDDDELNSHLTRMGERLLRNMPSTDIRFRFLLSDIPVLNAFALPGGRVYVTRKMVAFARNEDELAGILAHELGHGLMRDAAIDFTARMQKVLGVNQVGDRKDIFDKFHQLLENARRKPFRTKEEDEHREQVTADQISIHALARAGYHLQAHAEIWDRYHETQGKTGSWLSDLFGTTKPGGKRLREMLKTQAAIPANCVESRAQVSQEEFRKWQAAVVAYSGLGRKEVLHNVIWKKPLTPPLQADVEHIRFSSDGRLLLAQDDSGIVLLSREPFAPMFRIDAQDAFPAQFSPDSKSVVFHTPKLRVEKWDIASGQRLSVHEMVRRDGCLQTALSPDGRFLACYDSMYRLALIEVETGTPAFEKKTFYEPSYWSLFFLLGRLLEPSQDSGNRAFQWITMGFSSDSRYFLASARSTSPVAFDLTTRAQVSLPGVFRSLTQQSFAFLGPDRIAGINVDNPEKSAVVRFPSGEVVTRIPLNWRNKLAAPGAGDYLLLRPVNKFAAGVMDLKTSKIFMGNNTPAVDFYNDVLVNEFGDGTLDMQRLTNAAKTAAENVGRVALPRSPLGRVRTMSVSPDLKWIALSQGSRGAVWNLERGQQVHTLRGFHGAYFGNDGYFYADFPELEDEKVERGIAKVDLASQGLLERRPIEADVYTRQYGGLLLTTRPNKKGGNYWEKSTLEVRDTQSGAVLWSRQFPKETPSVFAWSYEGTMVLAWPVSAGAAKEEINRDSALKSRLAAMKEKEGDYLLEAVEARTGRRLGRLLVETGKGSFRIEHIFAAGDWLVIKDTEHRILVYSLSSGEARGKFFAERATLSRVRGLLCAESEPGRMSLYDLASAEKKDELVFPSPVTFAQFSLDGKRLFILTANQTAYLFDSEKW